MKKLTDPVYRDIRPCTDCARLKYGMCPKAYSGSAAVPCTHFVHKDEITDATIRKLKTFEH